MQISTAHYCCTKLTRGTRFLLLVGLLNNRFYTSSANNMENTSSESSSSYTSGTHSVAFVTTPDEPTAKKLAHSLVENKLAACVNLVPKIVSIYTWEGQINEDNEVLMIIKTRSSKIDEISKFVRANHPYSVAEVISLPIENGNHPYLDWITKSVPGV